MSHTSQIVVAALGDSITAGTPCWDPSPEVRATIPREALDDRHQWPFWAERADTRLVVENHGVNRERTDEIARRLDSVAPGVDILVVQGGINDLVQRGSPEATGAHLRDLVRRCKERVARVFVADVLPWNNGYPDHDGAIRRLNELIDELARAEAVGLLPFFATLEDPERPGRMRAAWTGDGNHPSLEGHRRLGAMVARELLSASMR